MKRSIQVLLCQCAVLLGLLLVAGVVQGSPAKTKPEPVLLVVMDPLAKELACECVKGHGQRDYRKLAARLGSALKQRVSIEFSDDLAESLAGVSPTRQIIVVGDQSLVVQGSKKARLSCHPVCELTDPDGNTAITALFIARFDDPAKELKDINGRKVIFGLADGDEKIAASLAALRAAGVEPPATLQKRPTYSDAALDLLDSDSSPHPVAVIPDYALLMLEGCGSVKPGNLKVIGRTQPVPFITLFVSDSMPPAKQETLLKTLLKINRDAKLLKALESRDGFKPVQGGQTPGTPKSSTGASWPDWRGPARDGHVARLPARLPATANIIWKKAAMNGGLAGLSVSDDRLIMAERDFADENDVYRCFNTSNGELLWREEFPAKGKLDYGQAPRATPVIHNGKAYLLSALGDLRCVDAANGKVIWQRNLPREFKAPLPTWGLCSTPLLVDDLLIVNPGGTNASLVALDCATGRTRWTTPGLPAAYSSFICAEFGGRRQVVGYDQHSLGGWDVKTGRRLWQLVPPAEGDFNVPTPVAVDGGLIASTENNGTRLYRFDESGRIIPKPAAAYAELSPDTVSPVVTCGRVFGANSGLRCLDVHNGLKPVWQQQETALEDHLTLIADDDRVLVVTLHGELILLDGRADKCSIISRLRLFDDDVEIYSHPALVGSRLYVRGGSSLLCVDIGTD